MKQMFSLKGQVAVQVIWQESWALNSIAVTSLLKTKSGE